MAIWPNRFRWARSFRPLSRPCWASTRKQDSSAPWIGYLALRADECIGTCAFKSPPNNGRVEIAYFTFPGHEGQGVATLMARELLRIAAREDASVCITAQTLPEENASTAILAKLGFRRTGVAQDDEAGEVWAWELVTSSSPGE